MGDRHGNSVGSRDGGCQGRVDFVLGGRGGDDCRAQREAGGRQRAGAGMSKRAYWDAAAGCAIKGLEWLHERGFPGRCGWLRSSVVL